MLEEQGTGLIKSGILKLLKLLANSYKPFIEDINRKTRVSKNKTQQSVKDDAHLKAICIECKRQNISFAIKKEENGDRQLLYKKKDADLVEKNILNVLEKGLKPKKSLMELISRNKDISGKEAQKIKNKEVSREER